MRSLLVVVLVLSLATAAWADWPTRPHQAPVNPGVLLVISRPWSNVRLDGRRMGPTPLRAELAPGFHRLRLQSVDGVVHEERVRIVAGQTVRIMHRF